MCRKVSLAWIGQVHLDNRYPSVGNNLARVSERVGVVRESGRVEDNGCCCICGLVKPANQVASSSLCRSQALRHQEGALSDPSQYRSESLNHKSQVLSTRDGSNWAR